MTRRPMGATVSLKVDGAVPRDVIRVALRHGANTVRERDGRFEEWVDGRWVEVRPDEEQTSAA